VYIKNGVSIFGVNGAANVIDTTTASAPTVGQILSGKTAFATNIAENAAIESKATVAVFSLEMSKEALLRRMLASQAWVDQRKLQTGFLGAEDHTKLTNALGQLVESRLFIDDTAGISLSEMRAKARRLKQNNGGLDMIVIDYLQLMSATLPSNSKKGYENRTQEVSAISRGLKALAGELDDGLLELRETERQALMLRYFEGHTHREIGQLLGAREDAVRMRIDKALGRLTRFFRRRGYAVPTVATTITLLGAVVIPAPAGFAMVATRSALAAGGSGAATGLKLLLSRLLGLSQAQTSFLCLAIAAGPVTWEWNVKRVFVARAALAQSQLEVVREEAAQFAADLSQLRAEAVRLDASVAEAEKDSARYEEAASKLEALKGQVRALLAGSGPSWPTNLLYVRVPKAIITSLNPVYRPMGRISELALELYGITAQEKASAEQALAALLNNYALQLVEDPKSKIARITTKNPAALPPLLTKIYQLKYASPTNLLASVQGTIDPKRSKVLPDTRTSQLVLVATENEITAVDELVLNLDTQTKQVLIEARLVETVVNPSTTKGVDWSGTLKSQNVAFGNGITTGTTTTGPGTPNTTTTVLPGGATTSTTTAPSYNTSTVLSSLLGGGGFYYRGRR